MQDKYSVMSNQIDNMHISTSSISNSTSLSPTTIPEVTVDDAIATATAMFENSVHKFDSAFDLVADNSEGLQMPLLVSQVISKPIRCAEIDYPNDTQSRRSIAEEDECLKTNTNIVFDGSLQRNEFALKCQVAYLELVGIEKSVSHKILPIEL
ncbi:hypothetical protein BC332_28113 [Capsicum chinense]|nr:hypothetical protein BC332_28113 [Capsicum chinense]